MEVNFDVTSIIDCKPYFVHIDARDYKSFWYGQAQQVRTTFGTNLLGITNGSSSNTTAGSIDILCVGDCGDQVKVLQGKLITLGYSCGSRGADGVFGTDTKTSVLKFQKDHNIPADGVVGYQTMTALNKAVEELEDSTTRVVKVTASVLNIRKGPGTNYAITGAIRDKSVYRIVSEATGTGASKWGKLSDGRGWISLDYCTTP